MKNSIGAILKAAREEQGLDLGKIANDLRIRLVYLQEIEDENTDKLVHNVYKLGYIKIYSAHLGVDIEDHIGDIKKLNDIPAAQTQVLDIVKTKPPLSVILFSLSLLLLTVYLVTYLLNKPDRNLVTTQDKPGISLLKQDDKIILENSNQGNGLVAVLALADTKIKVENKEGKLLEQITLKAKQSHILPDQDHLVITLEEPTKIEIYEFSSITMDKKKISIW